MKKFSKIAIFLFLSIFFMTSCDLLNVDSNRQVSTDEFNMKASNDSLYSMFGIFSKLEKLADSYAF